MAVIASMWGDYVDLPETQFLVHHWLGLLLLMTAFGLALAAVRRVTRRKELHAWQSRRPVRRL